MMRLDEAAREWLGVPFMHQGRTIHGIDCLGLVVNSLHRIGIMVEDEPAYARDPHGGKLDARLVREFGAPVAFLGRAQVVSFTWARASRHIGIVGEFEDRLTLIHTSSSVGRVTEESIDAKWVRRITGIYQPELPA